MAYLWNRFTDHWMLVVYLLFILYWLSWFLTSQWGCVDDDWLWIVGAEDEALMFWRLLVQRTMMAVFWDVAEWSGRHHHPDDEGSKFLWNVGQYQLDNMAQHLVAIFREVVCGKFSVESKEQIEVVMLLEIWARMENRDLMKILLHQYDFCE